MKYAIYHFALGLLLIRILSGQAVDPFAPEDPSLPKLRPDSGRRDFSFSVFAVPASKYMPRLIGEVNDSELYQEMIDGVANESVNLIRHETVIGNSGVRASSLHPRFALSPWYYNLLQIDTLGRYNPRSTDTFEIEDKLELDAEVGVGGEVKCQFNFHYSPGKRVIRFFGARMPGRNQVFPQFVELPAAPNNVCAGWISLSSRFPQARLLSVQQVYQPLPEKQHGWRISPDLHLTFVKVIAHNQPKKVIGDDYCVFVRAIIYDISAKDYRPGMTHGQIGGAKPVALAAVASNYGKEMQTASLATYMFGDQRRSEVKPEGYGGIDGAQGAFNSNLAPEPLSLGICLLATAQKIDANTGNISIDYDLQFDPRGPRLFETKLSYRDDKQEGRPYKEAWLDHFEVFTESAKGRTNVVPGRASEAIVLKANKGSKVLKDGKMRIAFFFISGQ